MIFYFRFIAVVFAVVVVVVGGVAVVVLLFLRLSVTLDFLRLS